MCRKLLLLIFAIAVKASEFQTLVPCNPLQVGYGQVCVNDANYCDTLNVPIARAYNSYTLVTSSLSGDRFSYKYGRIKPRNPVSDVDTFIEIEREEKCGGTKFTGFGGGMSSAVSYVLNRLPENIRNCVYNSYFLRKDGMGLSKIRLTIGGTSFDSAPWTYAQTPVNDTTLSGFTELDPRDVQRNLQVKEIMKIAQHRDFQIHSVPYSAPPWMKANNDFVGGATSQLKPEYYQAWADYYVRYLDLMQKDGIPISAVTTGDEPIVASFVSDFEFMGWKAAEQANYLGPTLRASSFNKVKILAFDDNRAEILKYLAEMVASAPDFLNYIDGFAVHGHTDYKSSATLLQQTLEAYPDKPIQITEKSFGIGNVPKERKGVLRGSWKRAENFTIELIDSLNNGASAFLYWNFILDNLGGPNYAKNYIDSPIIVNENYTAVNKQPMFYAFAYFAKFIPVGSQRITARVSGTDISLIHAVAYSAPDGTISMVLYNFSETKAVTLSVNDKSRGEIRLVVNPKSINTLIDES